MSAPLWTPSPERAQRTLLARFLERAGRSDFAELHRWSVAEPEAFWRLVWEFCEVRGAPWSACPGTAIA